MYDSREDTTAHIHRVQELVGEAIANLFRRGVEHDASKLAGIEKAGYDELGENLRQYSYGTPEYKAQFQQPGMKEAIAHHYAHNRHHPEHYPDGIDGMSLFDLLEMVLDWKAASERHADGDIRGSLPINVDRFEISPQLAQIIENTMIELGWQGVRDEGH